jgi:hypothetical protein
MLREHLGVLPLEEVLFLLFVMVVVVQRRIIGGGHASLDV